MLRINDNNNPLTYRIQIEFSSENESEQNLYPARVCWSLQAKASELKSPSTAAASFLVD
jgi:hypothetical protein